MVQLVETRGPELLVLRYPRCLFLEPARAEQVAFTAPYVLIEGVYAVPDDSPLRTVADVDAAGVRIGVKLGSAYDLFLTRTLARATLVRGDEGTIRAHLSALERMAPGALELYLAVARRELAIAVARGELSVGAAGPMERLLDEARGSLQR